MRPSKLAPIHLNPTKKETQAQWNKMCRQTLAGYLVLATLMTAMIGLTQLILLPVTTTLLIAILLEQQKIRNWEKINF